MKNTLINGGLRGGCVMEQPSSVVLFGCFILETLFIAFLMRDSISWCFFCGSGAEEQEGIEA